MATMPGKTARYRPNTGWQPASYYGGFMPNIVPDQQMAMKASQFPPQSMIDSTFASLPTWASPEPAVASGIPQGDMVPPAEPQYASATPIPQTGSSVLSMLPTAQPTPAVAAASSLASPDVTNVQGRMLPRRSGGGFLEMLMGPSKNGMDGLPGLLGGPQQGGILQMLLGGDKSAAGLPRRAIPASAATDPRGFAIGEANRRNPNPTYNVSGDNNSFAPKSVQNSSRWQTGY
jgi:hypothetical protein